MRTRPIGPIVAVAVAVLTSVGLAADDKWETSPYFFADDFVSTSNQLIHGAVQTHDIQGSTIDATLSDQDFSFVAAKARHSYEVKIFNTNNCFTLLSPNCAGLDRIAGDGFTLLTAGIGPDGPGPLASPGWMTVRWIAAADQLDFIRVNGYRAPGGVLVPATNQYDIQMLDTTYLVPRWNNAGTQTTVFLVQNGRNSPISGSIFFHNAGGALIHTQALSLAPNALLVLPTAEIPALAGLSGSALIAHNGGYGALAGKAVALEPSTGFTFDTALAAIPY